MAKSAREILVRLLDDYDTDSGMKKTNDGGERITQTLTALKELLPEKREVEENLYGNVQNIENKGYNQAITDCQKALGE